MYGLLTSLGVQDAICKVYGNTNPFSVTQAAMKALSKSMSVEEQALRTGRRYFDLNAIYKRTKAMQDWIVSSFLIPCATNSVLHKNTNPMPETEKESSLKQLLEFYFSDSNLCKDAFLRTQIESNEEGWIPVGLLLTFNKYDMWNGLNG